MHGIKQLNVELKLSAGLSERTAMEEVHGYYDGFFQDAIKKALDSFSEDVDLMVDSIEIDLGPISPSDIPATLEKKLVDEISRRLQYSETSPQVLTKAMEKVFFKYLSSGYADMSILGQRYSSRDLCALVVRNILESHDSIEQFVSVIRESMSAFFRFIDIVEEKDLKLLLKQIWPEGEQMAAFEGSPDALRIISMALFYLEPECLSKMIDGGRSHDEAAVALWQERLMQAEDGTAPTAAVLLERLRNDYYTHMSPPRIISLLRDSLSRIIDAESGIPSPAAPSPESASSTGSTPSPAAPSSEPSPLPESSPLHLSSDTYSEDYPELSDDARHEYLIGKRIEKGSRVHLDDAGLVLLAPFFLQFFARLEYLDERSEFLSPVLQARAVHILRYIATGMLDNQLEEDMVLEKALCGLPFDFPSGVDFKLTPKEYEEVENLYSTVLKYWNPFKEKTVNSLRQAFFIRHGTIERDEVGWIVRVEGHGLDILMDEIPWGYSIVTLPWADMFYIDWQ